MNCPTQADDRTDLASATNWLLAERAAASLWITLIANIVFAFVDRFLPPYTSSLYLIRWIQLAVVVVELVALQLPAFRKRAVAVALVNTAMLCITSSTIGIMQHDVVSAAMALVLVIMFNATLLPWGMRPQLAAIAMMTGAILVNVYAVTGSFAAVASYPGVLAAIASATSVYIAYEFHRYRRDIDQRTLALRRSHQEIEAAITERKRIEEGQQHSERYFRSLIENTSDLIAVINPDGTGRYASPSYQRVLGYTDDAVNKLVFEFIHPDDVARIMEFFNHVLAASGASESVEFRVRHHDGSWRVLEGIANNLVDDPAVAGIVVNSHDVTERKQVEEGVRANERHFRSLIENASDLIAVLNGDGTLRYMSPSHQRVLGYGAEDLLGQQAFSFIHPDDLPSLLQTFAQTVESPGSSVNVTFRFRHRDGSWRFLEGTGKSVADGTAAASVVMNSHDITERKRAEEALSESEERYRELFENANDIIYTHDLAGANLSMNKAGEAMSGYTSEELRGMNVMKIVARHHREHGVWQMQRLLAGEKCVPYELDVVAKDGSQRMLEVNPRVIYEDGKPASIQGICRDITERKWAEVELQQAKAAAEVANHAKSEFLANMSHEIRTPMNGILGMTELTLNTALQPQQREYLEMVKSSGDSLLTVINDILDFSKVEAGKLELDEQDFSLRETVSTALKTLGLRATAKGVELAWHIAADLPNALVGDAGRLRQVLVNLVGNAIKFTGRGEVVVRVGADSQAATGAHLHFTVTDTGIGIPADKLPRIFHAFEQVDSSTTRRYGGTGLGLAISARLVALMGGRIWAESAVGSGSTFHFSVPFGLSHSQVRDAPVPGSGVTVEVAATVFSPVEERPRALRILLVEDNIVNQKLVVRLLENRGHVALVAKNGRDALAAVDQYQFDVVLMDLQMPEMDGFEATAAIRARERGSGSRLPIIALTAHAMKGDEQRCLEAGMDAYTSKPIDAKKLFDAIEQVVSTTAPRSVPARDCEDHAA